MNDRACVYTVLVGGYEDLLEQPIVTQSDIDFVCFVDDPELRSRTWQLRVIKPAFSADSGRSSRFPKICAHRVLPEYDVSLYIDNSVLLRARPEVIIEELLSKDSSMASIAHSFRRTVEDEFEAVVESGLDASWICAEQLAHYRIVDPASLQLRPVWSGLIVRRHNEPSVAAAMDYWWSHILRYSRRDQLSFWMAMRQEDFVPHVVELDNHVTKYHEWPRSTGRQRERAGALPAILELENCLVSLKEAEQTIRHLENELSRQLAQMAGLSVQLVERDRLLVHATSEANDLRQRIGRDAELIDALKARIADLEGSTSWRVTKPFRLISELARRRS